MLQNKKEQPGEKSKMHPRNKHRGRYNFGLLIGSFPELARYVKLNKYGDQSIDFFNPQAVKMLNKALLKHYYHIDYWDIPLNYLCPPIPGRADYIHHIAELLHNSSTKIFNRIIPIDNKIKCLDIGVGASCIYPIIGVIEYGWSFIGTDLDDVSIKSANKVIELNPLLNDKIEIRKQNNAADIFHGIIMKNELFDVTICNPPFHSSLKEAQSVASRKLSNLKNKKIVKPILNFGGHPNELWCEGGAVKFISNMIRQSKQYATSCFWFSTLISKKTDLPQVYKVLKKIDVNEVNTIEMGQGNKKSRIVVWTFLNTHQRKKWADTRWHEGGNRLA